MQYECVHCEVKFDFEGEGRPRCPKCMRVHDIRQVEALPGTGSRRAWIIRVALLALAAVMVAGGGAWYWFQYSEQSVPEQVPPRPLSERELSVYLKREGVDPQEFDRLLQPGAGIEKFAQKAVSGKTTLRKKARGVVDALRARARKRAFVDWPRVDPRDTPPAVADRVLEMIGKDGAQQRLYPLEIAALSVAALRSVGVKAMLAEAFAFAGDRSPADPSGRFGYFVLAVTGQAGAEPLLFDPYGGRTSPPAADDVELLTDVQAVGLALNLTAVHVLARQQDVAGAISDSDAALRLAPRSPSVRGVRALVLLAGGGASEARSELESALQIRPDAPQRNNLASLLLPMGDLEGAARQVSLALQQYRDFASAHVTLASVHLARSEYQQARSELEEAERLNPDLPVTHLVWAHYHSTQGDLEQAIDRARQGVEARPDDSQAHLILARMYREAARYDDMRREARQVVELTPGSRREEIKQLLLGMLGPTALEEPDLEEEETEGTAELSLPEPGKLKLGKGLRLLDEEKKPKPGALMGDGEKGQAKTKGRDPLLLFGDTKKLRLRDSDSKLELKP